MKIYDVIQYEGPNDVLVWKHEAEDFNTMTQLIVHESQEAVFFKNGQALDLFRPGRYTLETQNIPILGKLARLPSGGKTPFHCEVYFVNRAVMMNMVWGTNAPILLRDPEFGININVRANGQMALAVQDSRKLLVKLVGTVPSLDMGDLTRYFKGVLMMYVKDVIANIMISGKISINAVSGKLVEISDQCRRLLSPVYEEYGLSVRLFNVAGINAPMDDPGYQQIQRAIASAASRNIQGYTWQQEQAFDVARTAASNEGISGSVAGAGMGAGMAAGMGVPLGMGVGALAGGVFSSLSGMAAQSCAQRCPHCGASLPEESAFCPRCGQDLKNGLVCRFCKKTLPAQSVFCPHCGKKQAVSAVCAACGAEMDAGSKFCAHCGAPRKEEEA